ncbi:hypothetical protein QTG54_000563 [Skeletonema marinoi]|uniref:Subtilisin n=1 Tax=Skeletonema marinoi TaxID=267567 RepID=A0AAD8YNC5_9STRA|nr:hypothetical protein QTG54_000563 [Skeletonema marinoi]
MKLHLLLLLLFYRNASAQQSAAGQDTVIGIVGRDFVMMGADTSSSGGGGISLTSSNIDKLAVIHDGGGDDALNNMLHTDNDISSSDCFSNKRSVEQQAIVVGFAGDAADADVMAGTLKIHTQVREYEAGIGNDIVCTFDGESSSATISNVALGSISPAGLDAESIAYFARKEIATRMRSRQPLQLCLLVGGMKQVSAASSAYRLSSKSNTDDEKQNHKPTMTQERVISRQESPTIFSVTQTILAGSIRIIAELIIWLSWLWIKLCLVGTRSKISKGNVTPRSEELIMECFEQLRQRYLINSPQPPRIKCIDAFGVRELESKYKQ